MDNIERMRRAREEREFKRAMTERGYQPGKSAKALNHGIDKKPKQASKNLPFRYGKKPAAPRPLEQSTLHNKIGNFKQRNESELNESDFEKSASARPRTQVQAQRSNIRSGHFSKPNYNVVDHDQERSAERRSAVQRQRDEQFRQQQREEELQQMSPDSQDQSPGVGAEGRYNQEPIEEQELSPEQESPAPDHQVEGLEVQQDQDGERHEENEGEDGNPLLFVDVNLGPGRAERIVVYEGDTAERLADEFTERHNLDANLRQRLVGLLQDQIAGLLARIDEEVSSYSENQDQENAEVEAAA